VHLAQIRSAVPEIFHTIKVTDNAKNRMLHSSLCAVKTISSEDTVWVIVCSGSPERQMKSVMGRFLFGFLLHLFLKEVLWIGVSVFFAVWMSFRYTVSNMKAVKGAAVLLMAEITQTCKFATVSYVICSRQLSLLPSSERELSTSQSAVMLRGWGVKAGMVHSTCG